MHRSRPLPLLEVCPAGLFEFGAVESNHLFGKVGGHALSRGSESFDVSERSDQPAGFHDAADSTHDRLGLGNSGAADFFRDLASVPLEVGGNVVILALFEHSVNNRDHLIKAGDHCFVVHFELALKVAHSV
jgi:hypothetical protein